MAQVTDSVAADIHTITITVDKLLTRYKTPMLLAEFRKTAPKSDPSTLALIKLILQERSTKELEGALERQELSLDPAVARSAQATENVWRTLADEFGLLTSTEVAETVRARSGNRTLANDWRKQGKLLGVKRLHGYEYPGFQFDRQTGAVLPVIAPLLALATESDRTPEGVAIWLVTPTTYFTSARPVDFIHETDRLLDVAERAWSVEW